MASHSAANLRKRSAVFIEAPGARTLLQAKTPIPLNGSGWNEENSWPETSSSNRGAVRTDNRNRNDERGLNPAWSCVAFTQAAPVVAPKVRNPAKGAAEPIKGLVGLLRAVWQAVIVIYCQLLQVLRRPVESAPPDSDRIADAPGCRLWARTRLMHCNMFRRKIAEGLFFRHPGLAQALDNLGIKPV
jgi:hypothetical protein